MLDLPSDPIERGDETALGPGGDRRERRRRAAAVGAAGAAIGSHRANKKAEEAQAREPDATEQAPAAESAGLNPDALTQLEQLGKLHEQGVLTDEEFEAGKAKLLGG